MNADTPRTNDIIEQIKEFRTSSVIYALEQFSRTLERERAEVTEQRDKALSDLQFRRDLYSLQTKQLDDAREQRDRLLEQQEQWRLSSVCRELVEQRNEARKLAERYRYLSCDSQEEADAEVLPWENNQTNHDR